MFILVHCLIFFIVHCLIESYSMGLLLRVIYTGDQKEFVQSCKFLGF